MGAEYSFELISIETYAPQFIGHDKFFLGSVCSVRQAQLLHKHTTTLLLTITATTAVHYN